MSSPILPRLRLKSALSLAIGAALCGCANDRGEPFSPAPRPTLFAEIPYSTFQGQEPGYRFYPGDVLDVATPSAPELNRTVTVQPDGRITLPLVPPVMAADHTLAQLQASIGAEYVGQLVHPEVEITLRTAGPIRVFVGGEVTKPGVYDMPGDINALQAVIQAGDFTTRARRVQVVVIRRGPGGRAMMRIVDLRRAVFDPAAGGSAAPLRRFDIVYVPRTSVSEVGLFVQQYVRDVLPIQFSYAINGFSGG